MDELATTNLIRPVPLLLQRPRLTAGLWCGLWGFAAVGAFCGLPLFVGPQVPLAAGFSALVAGFLVGGKILDPRATRSPHVAVFRAIPVVVLAQAIFIGIYATLLGIAAGASATMWLPVTICIAIFSIFMPGILTIPIGCFGAWLLYKMRGYTIKPKGCRLHGYRKAIPATTSGAHNSEATPNTSWNTLWRGTKAGRFIT